MTQEAAWSTSYPSKSLPWLLPSVLTLAPIQSTCIFISPWVEDITLKVGELIGTSKKLEEEVTLSTFLRWLQEEHQKKFILYIRCDEIEKNLPRLRHFREVTKGVVKIGCVANLHAKMVITDNVIIETSANLLERSFYVNVESVTVHSNPHLLSSTFLQDFQIQQGGIWKLALTQ